MLALINFIKAGFKRSEKASTTFIDLKVVYDAVWKDGLIVEFQSAIPYKKNMMSNRTFHVILSERESQTK